MNRWRSAAAILLGLFLAGALAWAQESPEASRPVRGTGEAGRPSSGVLTIQGIFQGRPVTVDFHHTAAALAVTVHSAGIAHVTSVTHIAGTVRVSDIAGNVAGVTASALNVGGNIAHVASVVHVTTGLSPHITTLWVNCGASAAVAIQPKVDTLGKRRDLELQNAGTVNIYLGGTHATVTTTTGYALHAGTGMTSRLKLENFQGRVDCIADGPNQTLQIIEVWR